MGERRGELLVLELCALHMGVPTIYRWKRGEDKATPRLDLGGGGQVGGPRKGPAATHPQTLTLAALQP
jgi:hypothetical protein